MRHYTKRTIALCLASLVTVLGAFEAENYKNNLMSLRINNGSGGYISITALTEKPYNLPIKTVRQDANTYVLIFPETECEAKMPKLTNYENIESIGISTFPYTPERDGYTKITVKTLGSPTLKANTMLYISDGQPASHQLQQIATTQTPVQQTSYWAAHERTESVTTPKPQNNNTDNVQNNNFNNNSAPIEQNTNNNNQNVNNASSPDSSANNAPAPYIPPQDYSNTGTASEHTTAIICVLVLIMLIGFIMLIGKDKMANVVGDNNEFDIDSDNSKKGKKSSKTKKIRKAINTLDKTYSSSRKRETEYQENKVSDINSEIGQEKVDEQEEIVTQTVVDLDTLYQEKTQQKEEEVDDLAEFLNEFTFDDEPEAPEEEPFNEELYQEIINSKNIKFSKSDIDMINQLIQTEITQQLLDDRDKYKQTVITEPKTQTKSQVLENLLTTYSISQNINFSNDDVKTIQQLMDVELDKSFVTDLTTNPNRVQEAENEIKQTDAKPHNASEVMTLNVKDLLPNLSQELEKQGSKPIESEVKKEVVYFSEGYDVSKLSVANELNDLSSALKTANTNEYRPSDTMPIVENGYEVSTLSIKDELPDLNDVKANPNKYADKKPEKVVVDENALLQSISNVTFKPFYTDVEEELNQFENFEIINSENGEYNYAEETPQTYTRQDRVNDDAEKLLKLIETQQAQRALKKQALEEARKFKKELLKASKKKEEIKQNHQVIFEYEGKKYILLKTISCNEDAECNLAQSDDGYSVFGYINGVRKELKHYDSLTTTNMQVRTNEKDADGNTQYLVKIGTNKFLIKSTQEIMEFVMDLC